MMAAIEDEPHPMVQDRSPAGEIHLTFYQARQPVIGWPAVEKVAVLCQALAPCGQITSHQAVLTMGQMHCVHLVPAIPAVLLALAGHSVHQSFLGAVIERVDRGVKETLQVWLAGSGGCAVSWRDGTRP